MLIKIFDLLLLFFLGYLFMCSYKILIKDDINYGQIPGYNLSKLTLKERKYLKYSKGLSLLIVCISMPLLRVLENTTMIYLLIGVLLILLVNLIVVDIKFIYKK